MRGRRIRVVCLAGSAGGVYKDATLNVAVWNGSPYPWTREALAAPAQCVNEYPARSRDAARRGVEATDRELRGPEPDLTVTAAKCRWASEWGVDEIASGASGSFSVRTEVKG